MSPEESVRAVTRLRSVWPDRSVTAETVREYAMAWSDLPVDAVQRAVTNWIANKTFFPSPGEIRTLAVQGTLDTPDAEMAWSEVTGNIGRFSYAREPSWSSSVLERAVRAIGWRQICLADDDAIGTLRAQFRNTYNSLLADTVRNGDIESLRRDAQERRAALAGGDSVPLALPARDGPVAAQKRGVPTDAANDPRPGDAAPESASRRRARLRWEKLHPGKPFPDRPFAFGPTGNRVEDAMSFMLTIPSFRALPEDRQRHILDEVRADVERRLADEAANS